MKDFNLKILAVFIIFACGFMFGRVAGTNEILSKSKHCESAFIVDRDVTRCWDIKEIQQ